MGSTDDIITTADDEAATDRRGGRHLEPGIRWRRSSTAVVAAVATLALAACSGDDDAADASFEPAAEESADMPADMPADDAGAFEVSGELSGEGRTNGAPTDAGIDLGAIGRDVIIEMRVVLSSDDIERTVATIATDAAALGGGIASSDVEYGDASTPPGTGEDGYALLVVKVPPVSIDTMLGRIGDAGTVRSINQSAQDVTEQLVDLDVRIGNARQSVETVRSFMERTEDLGELVALESELTRRQTELEQLEAQQRNLSDRVALSTITIEVLPTAAVPEPVDDGGDSLGDALRSGWEAFVAALFTIAFVAAVLLPFLLVGLVIGIAVWLIRRRPADGIDTDEVDEVDDVDATNDAERSDRALTASGAND